MPADAPHAPGTLRRGVRVMARGIRDEPRIFTLAVLGSAVFGASLAGSGWVLGQVTDAVVRPRLPRPATSSTGDVWLAGGRAGGGPVRSPRPASSSVAATPPSPVPAAGPLPPPRSAGSTCASRWPGTTATPPGSC